MEVEIPAPLSVAPPTPAIPEETENVEINQQQQPVDEPPPFITSPLNESGQMLPPGTPAHKSVDPVNEDQVVIIQHLFKICYWCVVHFLKINT